MALHDILLLGAVLGSTAFTAFLLLLPSRRQPHRKLHDGPAGSKTATSVQVLVLGDIGRSPRMQYHAISIAKNGGQVDLIGYHESALHPDIISNSHISVVPISPPPRLLQTESKTLFLILGPLKVLWQIWNLWLILGYRTKPARWMLVQNPPSIPTLALAQVICFLRNTHLIIDWHNFGWSILALKLGHSHPLVKAAKWYEIFFGRFATANFAVTSAMSSILKSTYHIPTPIFPLHDRPPTHFQPLSSTQRSVFLARLPTTAPYASVILAGTTRLLVSSTSWTPDEDFSLLLDALVIFAANTTPKSPRIIAIITGKGPQQAYYLARIRDLQPKLEGRVTVVTAWLSAEDYPLLLGAADLGVSLHKSSSGVDLPMKVVDMLGCGLPVVGWSKFESWGELIREGENGKGFGSAEELAKILQDLFRPGDVALEPDALCACRVLVELLKHDFIRHNIVPVAGYSDLARAGEKLVQPMRTSDGGDGGVVVCLGVGGLVDLGVVLGLQVSEDGQGGMDGVEVWVVDARRPWNLGNVFAGRPSARNENSTLVTGEEGVENGRIQKSYNPGKGGIIVFDDGDIEEELGAEQAAYCALAGMPVISGEDDDSEASETESENDETPNAPTTSGKRKSSQDREEEDGKSDDEDSRPRQRRRSNSSSPIATPSRPRPRGLLISSNHLSGDSRSNSPSDRSSTPPVGPEQPSARALRRRFIKLRRDHEGTLRSYYELGNSYSEPVSSLMYSLASELGREDNDLLWYAIVGIGSLELYGRDITGVGIGHKGDETRGSAGWGGERGGRIRQLLRDEVRRLNPPKLGDTERDTAREEAHSVIPTTARSPTDNSIRLSPEPKFLLIRHWSLYDSMLHSPYLAARLQIWSDSGRKRLHKLLAKMGVSLTQSRQTYAHMDMDLKRCLRERLLKYAPLYGLDGLVPPVTSTSMAKEGWGFVRSWGWKACLSANDVAVIIGAILEVGKTGVIYQEDARKGMDRIELEDEGGVSEGEAFVSRFWEAYDGLGKYDYLMRNPACGDAYDEFSVDSLKSALPTAMQLHRAILRTGTSLIEKHQIRHLRAFRMAVVREGPDVSLFTHPSALTKLALWLGEAIAEQERDQRGKLGKGGRGTPLVVAGLNEPRGVYVIVGTGGGGRAADLQNRKEEKRKREEKIKAREARRAEKEKKRQERAENMDNDDEEEEESESDSSEDDELSDAEIETRGYGRNRFGNAFQEVVNETNARVRIDSFEHCVVEVKKEDLSGFLESLSMKAVVG
ncbi:MAG: hypothetical protein M1839_006400 [Geoglossum umbratile]|nr:MAG: hypothetical protein M1839_006400 [Geoglossum umbratile]